MANINEKGRTKTMAKNSSTAKLTLLTQKDEKERHEAEEQKSKLTRLQIKSRAREIRDILETWSERIAAVHFDVYGDIPRSLDYVNNPDPADLAARLCPLIKYKYARLDKAIEESRDQWCDLGSFQSDLADTAFAIGVLAGAVFTNAPRRELDRLERGLVHAVVAQGEVKDD